MTTAYRSIESVGLVGVEPTTSRLSGTTYGHDDTQDARRSIVVHMVPMRELRARFAATPTHRVEQNGACAQPIGVTATAEKQRAELAVPADAGTVLELVDRQAYRILTTAGKVFDHVRFSRPDMAFRIGNQQRLLPLDAVERVARLSATNRRSGGERFVPIAQCYLEPVFEGACR